MLTFARKQLLRDYIVFDDKEKLIHMNLLISAVAMSWVARLCFLAGEVLFAS